MTENYHHYISKQIKLLYKRRLVAPIIYLSFLILLWVLLPLSDILFPQELTKPASLPTYYQGKSTYVQATLKNLYFTGYTNTLFGRTTGYYYYTMWDDTCVIALLSPHTCEEGLPFINSALFPGQILHNTHSFQGLLTNLAKDLNWTESGISEKVSTYFISEPAFHMIPSVFLMTFYFATGLYALVQLISSLIYIRFPVLSPPCQQLGRFGKPATLLALAENELATLPQLATEDMFITEHYFIEIANSGIAIVPIDEMIWIYKHSTLHKLLWYHFSISYTLHITANKHLYLRCPKNMKSDIDGIIDYLSEANHNILVGFNEENRLKVQEVQDYSLQLEKLIAFLKRRI
ncbi:MAG: DUF6709 family protein [Lachnospiraceae bacterium]